MTTRTTRQVKRPAKAKPSTRRKSGDSAAENHLSTLEDREESTARAILIHAETGVGKTVLSIHKAPRPVLVLDCDNGIDSVIGSAKPGEIDVWGPGESAVMTYEVMDRFRDYVVAGEWRKPYKTIVVDNITAGQKPLIVEALEQRFTRIGPDKAEGFDPDIPSQQDWGKIYRMLDRWIREVRDGAKRRGAHFVVTSGSHSWMDESEGYEKIMPDIEGRERKQISTHMDAVGYLEIEDGERVLNLAPSGAIITKVRVPITRSANVPDSIKNPDFTKMLRAVNALPDPAKKGAKAAGAKPKTKTTRRK